MSGMPNAAAPASAASTDAHAHGDENAPGIALGNVVGSNIYNILLIGGVTMTISTKPVPWDLVDIELPLVAATALLVLLLCWFAHRIGRMLGAVLLLAFAAFNVALLA